MKFVKAVGVVAVAVVVLYAAAHAVWALAVLIGLHFWGVDIRGGAG